MSRSRNYTFTCNNWTEVHVKMLAELKVKYMIYGEEVGESLTPHLQGYVVFKESIPMSVAIRRLQGCHVEVAKGSAQQNIAYCSKDGKVTEFGAKPLTQQEKGDTEKARWANILAHAGDQDWLNENEPQVAILHDKALARAALRNKPPLCARSVLEDEWWYGPTGTGKSRKAYEEYPGAYRKDPKERWWDGYTDHEVVIIDDFDKYQVAMGGDLKRWTDHYEFQAPVKGGYIVIRPKKIIVTSNYRLDEIWTDEQTLEPLTRRFKVRRFGASLFDAHPSARSALEEPSLLAEGFNPGPQARVENPQDWSANWQGSSYGQLNMALFGPSGDA